MFLVIAEPELSRGDYIYLLNMVSPEKRERINRFHFFRDARNTLIGDILVRKAICQRMGIDNEKLVFATNEYGKPFLLNNPQIHFNISHTGNYVICAIDDQPIGIDIELIKSIDFKIAERFFTQDEKNYIISSPLALSERAFFEVWTKKESYIKWEGLGLSRPLTSFSVLDYEQPVQFHLVFENDEVISHLCTEKSEVPCCETILIKELQRM